MTLTTQGPAPAVPPGAPGPHTPPDAVHCTIDGFEVAVPKGTLIIRAAEQIGVQNFSSCPGRTPPAISSNSRIVVPMGASYCPGRTTRPDSE